MRAMLSAMVAGILFASVGIAAAQERSEETPGGTTAGRQPVVVELYTSQGCAACPPAEAMHAELSREPGVLVLSLHVDYWDYLGWKDTFGQAGHSERQRAYGKAHKARSIFTPQSIVQGAEILIGHDEEGIRARIAAHAAQPEAVALAVTRSAGRLAIRLAPRGRPVGEAVVQVVEFMPSASVSIEAGENAGQTHHYVNVVTAWVTIGRWDGSGEAEFSHPMAPAAGPREHAVIVQAPRHGPILAAAQAR